MTKVEHIEWCIERAKKEKQIHQALASFVSDMQNHKETKNHPRIKDGMPFLMSGEFNDVQKFHNWMNSFKE